MNSGQRTRNLGSATFDYTITLVLSISKGHVGESTVSQGEFISVCNMPKLVLEGEVNSSVYVVRTVIGTRGETDSSIRTAAVFYGRWLTVCLGCRLVAGIAGCTHADDSDQYIATSLRLSPQEPFTSFHSAVLLSFSLLHWKYHNLSYKPWRSLPTYC